MSHTPEQDAGRTGRTADSRASRSRFTVEKDAGERPAGGRAAERGQATEACGKPCFRKRGSPSRLICWMSTGPRGAELGRQPHPPRDGSMKNEHGPPPPPPAGCARDAGHPRPRACPWRHLSCSGSRECTGGRRAPGRRPRPIGRNGPTPQLSGSSLSPNRATGVAGGEAQLTAVLCAAFALPAGKSEEGGDQPPSAGGPSLQQTRLTPCTRGRSGPAGTAAASGASGTRRALRGGGERRLTGVTLPHTPRGGTTVGVAEWRW